MIKEFTPEELEQHVTDGFVSKRKHPTLPLFIYNYTPEATFANKWDEVTRTCRGLILDEKYNIIARPFRKFFNLDTSFEESTHVDSLPQTAPLVMEKMDGSLGILWKYGKDWGIATRGSFDSEQARWATDYAKNDPRFMEQYCTKHVGFCSKCPVLNDCLEGKFYQWGDDGTTTPLFEIIYPENKIVVNYGNRKELTLLGVVNNEDGTEWSYEQMKATGYPHVVKVYDGKSLSECVSESEMDIPNNLEGYVLRYDTGGYPFRIKIKFLDYVRLHKLTFTLNDRVLWEMLRDNKDPMVELDRLPEDAKKWATEKTKSMKDKRNNLLNEASRVFNSRPVNASRKEVASHFCQHPELQSICFAYLDGKDPFPIVYKKIEPQKADLFRRVIFNEEF